MDGESIIKMACRGSAQAECFCMAWATFVHTLDDCVDKDKPLSPDAVASAFANFFAEVAANPFFQTYKGLLFGVMMQSANYWTESHERTVPAERDILKAQWHAVIYQVAYLVQGWNHMREVTHKAMGFDYETEVAR